MYIWDEFLEKAEKSLGKEPCDKWLSSLNLINFDALNIYLEAPSLFHINWFNEHIKNGLDKELVTPSGKLINLHLALKKASDAPTKKELPLTFNHDPISPDALFETYYSDTSDITMPLLKSLRDQPPGTYNPVYIYGKEGSGKTHLLMALCNEYLSLDKKVFYVTGETFTQHVVRAFRKNALTQFRLKYRHVDLLVIDDIDVLSGRSATQEELFHTFNTLHMNNTQIVLASTLPPQRLNNIEERLISRFEWGVSLEIAPCKEEDIHEIALKRSHYLGTPLSDETARTLSTRFQSPKEIVKALDALLMRLPSFKGGTCAEDIIDSALCDLIKAQEKEEIVPDTILNSVSEHFNVSTEKLLGRDQSREVVVPRKIAMHLMRELLDASYPEIGTYFTRDHTTVMSGVKSLKESEKQIAHQLATNLV